MIAALYECEVNKVDVTWKKR